MSKPRLMKRSHSRPRSARSTTVKFYIFANPSDPLESGDEDATITIVQDGELADDKPGSPTIDTVVRNQFAAKLWSINNWPQYQAMGLAANNDFSIVDRQAWIDDLRQHGPDEQKTQLRCITKRISF